MHEGLGQAEPRKWLSRRRENPHFCTAFSIDGFESAVYTTFLPASVHPRLKGEHLKPRHRYLHSQVELPAIQPFAQPPSDTINNTAMMATRPGSAAPQSSQTPIAPKDLQSSQLAVESDERLHDTETMCRYPSKKCYNTRAVKRNGELHNLCDFHRQKANKNQRRLELKRKTRAQAAESQPLEKRLKQNKKPRQRTRRAPLSAHVAMQEEVRARRQAAAEATRAAAAVVPPSIATSFLQDLIMLDGVYDRTGFLPKVEPRALISMPLELTPLPTPGMGMQGLTSVKEEVLDRILLDGANDIAASVDANPTKLESLGSTVPEGKTSPVDVGENWGNLDFSDYWMVPSDQPTMSFDASSFVVDEDVFIADV